jgi:hypothetical protein
VYTQEETERLDQALVTFNEIGAKKLKNYRTNTKLHTAECTVGDALVTVRVNAEVRAEPEGIVAFSMLHAPKYIAAGIEADPSSLGLNIIERASDHSLYVQSMYKFPAPLQNRDLCNIHMWRKLDNSTYFMMQQSFPHESCPVTADFTRMTTVRHFMITKVAPRLSRVEMLCQLDINGSVGKTLNRMITLPGLTVTLLSKNLAGVQRPLPTRPPDGINSPRTHRHAEFLRCNPLPRPVRRGRRQGARAAALLRPQEAPEERVRPAQRGRRRDRQVQRPARVHVEELEMSCSCSRYSKGVGSGRCAPTSSLPRRLTVKVGTVSSLLSRFPTEPFISNWQSISTRDNRGATLVIMKWRTVVIRVKSAVTGQDTWGKDCCIMKYVESSSLRHMWMLQRSLFCRGGGSLYIDWT